jgi:hypothetical protein
VEDRTTPGLPLPMPDAVGCADRTNRRGPIRISSFAFYQSVWRRWHQIIAQELGKFGFR